MFKVLYLDKKKHLPWKKGELKRKNDLEGERDWKRFLLFSEGHFPAFRRGIGEPIELNSKEPHMENVFSIERCLKIQIRAREKTISAAEVTDSQNLLFSAY